MQFYNVAAAKNDGQTYILVHFKKRKGTFCFATCKREQGVRNTGKNWETKWQIEIIEEGFKYLGSGLALLLWSRWAGEGKKDKEKVLV